MAGKSIGVRDVRMGTMINPVLLTDGQKGCEIASCIQGNESPADPANSAIHCNIIVVP
jgi:hypothetical protein